MSPLFRSKFRSQKLLIKEKWLILFILVAMVPMFQNMSPFDTAVIDIRDIAPRKPAGNWNSDYANFFPSNNSGMTSLGDVQSELLGHHFNPYLREFESKYLTFDSHSFSGGGPGPAASSSVEKSSRWTVGLVNSNKLRVLYLNEKIFKGMQFSMETGADHGGLNLNITQDLGSNWGLGLNHQTDLRQSRVTLDYNW